MELNEVNHSEIPEELKTTYHEPTIVVLGKAEILTKSMSYGMYLDGDSNQDFRHKPA